MEFGSDYFVFRLCSVWDVPEQGRAGPVCAFFWAVYPWLGIFDVYGRHDVCFYGIVRVALQNA